MTDTDMPPASSRLSLGIVLRIQEDSCQILREGEISSVGFAAPFPSPRTERVSPGNLVAVASTPEGIEGVVFRWYDALILGVEGGLVRFWEPAHGEVVAQPRNAQQLHEPGTRAYLSAGLPGADWWVSGAVTTTAQSADVELNEVAEFCTKYDLWNRLS